jgi:hypothetical protein
MFLNIGLIIHRVFFRPWPFYEKQVYIYIYVYIKDHARRAISPEHVLT